MMMMMMMTLESSCQDSSNEGAQHMFSLRNKKIIFDLSLISFLIWSSASCPKHQMEKNESNKEGIQSKIRQSKKKKKARDELYTSDSPRLVQGHGTPFDKLGSCPLDNALNNAQNCQTQSECQLRVTITVNENTSASMEWLVVNH